MSFARVDGRAVVADFGGGAITSDAGALLLGATDWAIRLVDRFAACFSDGRTPGRVIHGGDVAVVQSRGGETIVLADHVSDRPRRNPALPFIRSCGRCLRTVARRLGQARHCATADRGLSV
jgi:hypothetical protein